MGSITEEHLQYIESAVNDSIGIFIPSVGQCGYATTPNHVHPSYSLIISFEPDSPVAPKGLIVNKDEYGCTAMSPGIPHEEEKLDNFTRYVAVCIEKNAFEDIWKYYTKEKCGPFIWTPFAVHQSVMFLIKEFIAEFEANKPCSAEMLNALGTCIMHKMIRSMVGINVSVDGISARLEIQRAIEIMHARFGERLTVSVLARNVNCSESHFSRLFKQETGLSPLEYLIRIRIDKAKILLSRTDKNATEIALECGFASASHFSGTFHKITGINPLQYRKNIAC